MALPPVYIPGIYQSLWKAWRRPEPMAYEDELKRLTGCSHVVLVDSGRAALWLILEALKSQYPGRDEVILPAYTGASVACAVHQAGLKIVLCDVEKQSFAFDQRHLRKLCGRQPLAILAHHLFGLSEDHVETHSICRDHGVIVIEDICQALGAKSNGQMLGATGDIAFASFMLGKPTTAGRGGAILIREGRFYDYVVKGTRELPQPSRLTEGVTLLKLLAYPLLLSRYLYAGVERSRLNPKHKNEFAPFAPTSVGRFTKCLIGVQLKALDRVNDRRIELANHIVDQLKKRGLKTLPFREGSIFLRLPMLSDPLTAKTLVSKGWIYGLDCVNEKFDIRHIAPYENTSDQFDNCQHIVDRLVTLPVHPRVRPADVERMVQFLTQAVGARSNVERNETLRVAD